MRRFTTLTLLSAYVGLLLLGLVRTAHAATAGEGPDSFAHFFWTQVDWASFGTAAFIALVAGAVRTGFTLGNKTPTLRVLVEGLGDALTSLAVGAIAFLCLMVYQAVRGPVNQWVMFGFIFAAGLMRGGFITLLKDTVQRGFAAVADGVVTWVATASAAWLKKKSEGEQP